MTTRRSALRVALAHVCYLPLVHLACALALAPWLVRALRDGRQWSWLAARLGRLPPDLPQGSPVWVHAVSVGEVKAARLLLSELRARGHELVLSTGTVTGMDTARRLFPDVCVLAWPLDLPWIVGPVLRRVRPKAVLMLELEVWPSFMRLADAAGIPQALVNGRVSKSSFQTYQRLKWWLPEFDRLDLVAAQTADYATRMISLGVPRARVNVCGNLKHDLAQPAPPAECQQLGQALGWPDGLPVFVAGSTHDGEDEAVLDAWLAAGGQARSHLALVPRHLDRVPDIVRMLKRREQPHVLRSSGQAPQTRVLLVDRMGELEPLFGLADVVFLGGSLVPVGGHNVLEPAAAGRPVLVGPHLESCAREAGMLESAGGLSVVADGAALGLRLRQLLNDEPTRQAMGEAARHGARQLAGATASTLALLESSGVLMGSPLEPLAQSATLGGSPRAENAAPGARHP